MLKSFRRHLLLAVVPVLLSTLLAACSSSQDIRRPVSNLDNSQVSQEQSARSAWGSGSGVQIYGTIDAGYGYSSTKTTVTRPDGSRSTTRTSHTGMHRMGR